MKLNTKYIVVSIAAISASMVAVAQMQLNDYEAYQKQMLAKYEKQLDSYNQKYTAFLRAAWQKYNAAEPEVRPSKPEPVKPVVYTKPTKPIAPAELSVSPKVVKLPKPMPVRIPPRASEQDTKKPEILMPQPNKPAIIKPAVKPTVKPAVKPAVKPTKPEGPMSKPTLMPQPYVMDFYFYGTRCEVSYALRDKLSLAGTSEANIADAWEALCATEKFDTQINSIIHLRRELKLGDWGYVKLVDHIATELGCKTPNEHAFMMAFLLNQTGYDARLARVGQKLMVMMPANSMLYGYSYLNIDGKKYFLLDRSFKGGSIYTYKGGSSKSYPLNMFVGEDQQLAGDMTTPRSLNSKSGAISLSTQVRASNIAFYDTYPQCDFSVYLQAPVNAEFAAAILPNLKSQIAGKSNAEAANILINFVQTAFEYKTDQQQFGYEKPLFVEQTFFYPYCDCEDRSILYAYLVRELLGLDVVLLDYPEHIATAVYFKGENVAGDYVTYNGKRYTVCDPTYIGASIGKAMPSFKGVQANIID